MEPVKYTTPSSDSAELRDGPLPDLDFDLPDMTGAPRNPPRVSIATMMERNRQLRQMFPDGLPTAEERWKRKTGEDFKL
jgi:hypothetical protein